MNKNINRALSILLTLVMLVGLLPVGALAEGETPAQTTVTQESGGETAAPDGAGQGIEGEGDETPAAPAQQTKADGATPDGGSPADTLVASKEDLTPEETGAPSDPGELPGAGEGKEQGDNKGGEDKTAESTPTPEPTPTATPEPTPTPTPEPSKAPAKQAAPALKGGIPALPGHGEGGNQENPPETHTVTLVCDPEGGGTISITNSSPTTQGKESFTEGEKVYLSISKKPDYNFDANNGLTVNGTALTAQIESVGPMGATYTASFDMPGKAAEVKALFTGGIVGPGGGTENQKYLVTVVGGTIEGAGIGIGGTVSSSSYFAAGATVTVKLNAFALVGRTFTGWSGADELVFTSGSAGSSTFSFTMPACDVTLTATYEDENVSGFTILRSVSPSAGGMLRVRHKTGEYAPDSQTSFPADYRGFFEIQAEKGYQFDRLEVNGVKVDVEDSSAAGALIYGFTLQSNMTAVAYFDGATICTVGVQADPSDGGTATGGGTVEKGQSATVTATANEGYTFDGWYEGGSKVSDQASYTFTVTGGRSLVAVFEPLPTHSVTLASSPASIGADLEGGGNYPSGTEITVKTGKFINGIDGIFKFEGWYAGDTKVSGDVAYTFTVTGDTSLTAKFKKIVVFRYNISSDTVDLGEGIEIGDIQLENAGKRLPYAEHEKITLTWNGNPVGQWWNTTNPMFAVDPTELGVGTHTLTLNYPGSDEYFAASANITVTVVDTHTVTVTADPTEGGTATGGGTVEKGQSATVTATANPGYAFDGWTENGVQISTENPYAFEPTGDTALTAVFRRKLADGQGGFQVSGLDTSEFQNGSSDYVYLSYTDFSDTARNVSFTLDPTQLSLYVDGSAYPAEYNEGVVKLDARALQGGTHSLQLRWAGDDAYAPHDSNTYELTLKKRVRAEYDNPTGVVYRGETFVLRLLDDADGTPLKNAEVAIVINGNEYERHSDDEGVVTWKINVYPGEYTVTVTYDGDETHYPLNKAYDTQVRNRVRMVYDNPSGIVYSRESESEGGGFRIRLLDDKDGTPVGIGSDVTFNLNGVNYVRRIDDKGSAKLNINVPPGKYVVGVTYDGYTESYPIEVRTRVRMISHDLTKFYRSDKQFEVRLMDDIDETPAGCGELVTFNINGVLYQRMINDDGVVKLNINLQPGTYVVTYNYYGWYAIANDITVLPRFSMTQESPSVIYQYEKFRVRLVNDENGMPVQYGNVTFNLNGVTYNRRTDDDGVATLNVNVAPGVYEITASYPDNGMTISISADLDVRQQGSAINYTVSVTSTEGGQAGGGGTVPRGTDVTLTATPGENYRFVRWEKNGVQVSTDNPYTFTPTDNVEMTAVFEKKTTTHTVSYAVEGGSFAAGTETTENVINGEKPANVPEGMLPDESRAPRGAWYQGDGDTPVDPASVEITGPTAFTYKFEEKVNCAIKTGFAPMSLSGNIRITGAGTYVEGSEVTLTATLAEPENRAFLGWVDSAANAVVSRENPYSFTVRQSMNLTAVFGAASAPVTTHAVTYAIEGGSFAEGTETTELVMNGQSPAKVPEGMKPDETHTATGAWYQGDGDTPVDPAAVSITGPTTFTWRFEPKARYTVSFYDGSTELTALTQTVIDGGYASQPDDPTKEGWVFKGWYADASFQTPFDFTQQAITGDTGVYARFLPIISVSAEAVMAAGDSQTAAIEPTGLGLTFAWKSSDTDVATIDENSGEIKAIKPGTTTITATAIEDSEITASMELTVEAVEISLTLADSLPVGHGQNATTNLERLGLNPRWTSSDPDVASITPISGVIRAHKPGTVSITVTARDNSAITASTQFTVDHAMSLAPFMDVNTSQTASMEPSNWWNIQWNWYSSDHTVADIKVSTGEIKALKPGTTTITARSRNTDGFEDSMELTVFGVNVIGPMVVGVSQTATIEPSNTGITFTWSSSDPTVASIDPNSGEIKALKPGTTTIRATAADGSGVTASLELTVETCKIEGEKGGFVGGTYTLETNLKPLGVAHTWSSSDPSVVEINPSTGVYRVLRFGTATVTVTADGDNTITASQDLNIRHAITDLDPFMPQGYITTASIFDVVLQSIAFTWSSSDPSVASIDPNTGEIRTLGAGTTNIMATVTDGSGITDSVPITVVAVVAADGMIVGESQTAVIAPKNLGIDFTWSSSDPTVASIDPNTGEIEALKPGKATITVNPPDVLPGDLSALLKAQLKATINVWNPKILIRTLEAMIPGQSQTAAISQSNLNIDFTWESSDPSVASIDPDTGEIKAWKAGTTIITATAVHDSTLTASRKLTVFEPEIRANSSMTVGQSQTAAVEPTGLGLTFTWSSDDPDVASIDENTGEIEALKAGTTTIRATATDGSGLALSMELTVKEPEPQALWLSIDGQDVSLGSKLPGEPVSITRAEIDARAENSGVDLDANELRQLFLCDSAGSEPVYFVLTQEEFAFVMPDEQTWLFAEYSPKSDPEYQISVTGGTASPTSAKEGSIVTLTAGTPPEGMVFNRWRRASGLGDFVNSSWFDEIVFFLVNGDAELEVVWENAPHTVSVQADPTEGGTVTGGGSFDHGSSVTVKAVPDQDNGYRFDGWYEGENWLSGEEEYTIASLEKDTALTARFKKYWTVTLDMNGGTILDTTGTGMVEITSLDLYTGYSQVVPMVEWMEAEIEEGSWITGPEDGEYLGVEIKDANGTKTCQPGEEYTVISDAIIKVLWKSTVTPVTIRYTVKDSAGNTVQAVTWQKGSGKSLDLSVHRSEDDHLTYGLFVSLENDGNTVGSGSYDSAEGSLKLSIKPEYLETLSAGDHTVKVNFRDGSATVKLTVLPETAQPTATPEPTPTPEVTPTPTATPESTATPEVTPTATPEPTPEPAPGTVAVEGGKTWDDADDQDGIRPKSITIHLLADGVKIGSVTVTEAMGWKWSFRDLPKSNNGKAIVYTIAEDAVEGYTAAIDGYNVTNVHEPATVSLTVKKVWNDSDDAARKRSGVEAKIVLRKTVNGVSTQVDAMEVGHNKGWTYTWEDLPAYEKGAAVTYSVKEELAKPNGYKSDTTKWKTVADGETITIKNTYRDPDITPGTGDSRKTLLWAGLMLTSALGCAAALLLAKRKQQEA